jgi:dTDP-4-dehydrorhamnose 3,5-epimerase
MILKNTELKDLYLVEFDFFSDFRGEFIKLFNMENFPQLTKTQNIHQINLSKTIGKGSVRGMHGQISPYLEYKYVTCIDGEIFDIAIDLRRNSKTFLKKFNIILSAEKKIGVLIPPGFVHGFQLLSDNCTMIYCHTNIYKPDSEIGLNVMDPILNIDWPMNIKNLSDKDKSYEFLESTYNGIEI